MFLFTQLLYRVLGMGKLRYKFLNEYILPYVGERKFLIKLSILHTTSLQNIHTHLNRQIELGVVRFSYNENVLCNMFVVEKLIENFKRM